MRPTKLFLLLVETLLSLVGVHEIVARSGSLTSSIRLHRSCLRFVKVRSRLEVVLSLSIFEAELFPTYFTPHDFGVVGRLFTPLTFDHVLITSLWFHVWLLLIEDSPLFTFAGIDFFFVKVFEILFPHGSSVRVCVFDRDVLLVSFAAMATDWSC